MSEFRVVVLASGSGSLFQALIDQQTKHGAKLVGLITDVDCPAIARAKAVGIPTEIVELTGDRETWNAQLVAAIDGFKPDLVISAGFMRILGGQVLAKYEGRLINTHPALLPNFPGAHAVRDALAQGAFETGSTIHFVDSGVDTGKVITQKALAIHPGETESQLHERIKVIERELLVDVLSDFVSGKIDFKPTS